MASHSICFVSPSSYGYFNSQEESTGGGAERQIHLLSNALSNDYDVSVIVGDYGQSGIEKINGVTLYKAHSTKPASGVKNILKVLKLAKTIRQVDADVYISRGRPLMSTAVYNICSLLGKKWIFHVSNDSNLTHQPKSMDPVASNLYETAIKNSNAIVAQTDFQKNTLKDEFDISAAVIPNGYPKLDIEDMKKCPKSFLWVGRFDREQKKPHIYLELAEEIPEYEFGIIGKEDNDKEYANLLKKRAEEIDNVKFIGSVKPDEIHKYYLNSLALINTSEYEGFPNTFLEAWRCKTPTLTLSIDQEKYVTQDINLRAAKGDVDVLIDNVIRVAEDSDYREYLSDFFYNEFEDNYQIGRISEKYSKVLENVLNDE